MNLESISTDDSNNTITIISALATTLLHHYHYHHPTCETLHLHINDILRHNLCTATNKNQTAITQQHKYESIDQY